LIFVFVFPAFSLSGIASSSFYFLFFFLAGWLVDRFRAFELSLVSASTVLARNKEKSFTSDRLPCRASCQYTEDKQQTM
jgi:hypothetical protein